MPEGKNHNDTNIEIIRAEIEPEVPPPKKRQTYYIRVELIEKLRAYAYWERKNISEVINMALDQFFSNLEVKKIPRQKDNHKSTT